MITIKEMADKIGVSPTTVSNVIHGKIKEVSKETIEKVNNVVKECNYIPNMNARTLAQKYSKIIGVVMNYPDTEDRNAVQDPFNSELIGALESEIRAAGYYMMLYASNSAEDILSLAATWNVDGVIVLGLHADDCYNLRRKTDMPVVFIDCYFNKDDMEYVNVGLDDKIGAYNMTKYLIEQGHKRIAFLADSKMGTYKERWNGYLQALKDHNISYHEDDFHLLGRSKALLEKSIEQVYHKRDEYTALFFVSDYYAVKAMNYFLDHGVKVPDDISIVGFDDNILGKNMRPKLTTVRQDPSTKGILAVEQLKRLICNDPLETLNIRLSTEIIIRDTVKCIN